MIKYNKETAQEVSVQEQPNNKIVTELGNSRIEITKDFIICEVRK